MTWTLLLNFITSISKIWTLCISKAGALFLATHGVHKPGRDILRCLPSMDTWVEGGRQDRHLWMVQGWHSNFGIHGYLDRLGIGQGGQPQLEVEVANFEWSMDKPGKTISNIISYTLTFRNDMGLSMVVSEHSLNYSGINLVCLPPKSLSMWFIHFSKANACLFTCDPFIQW